MPLEPMTWCRAASCAPSPSSICGSREPICAPGSSPSCTIRTSIMSAARCARVTVPIDDVAPALTAPSSVEASLALRDLERAIARLPEEQRQVILLVGLEGMGYDEAAKILGIPVGTVRSRLSRGRDSLRVLMDLKDEATDIARTRAASALRMA